jgi:Protein of unknown function (DUF2849)
MKIITANRLDDGAVVFLSAQGWVTDIARSAVLSAPDAIEAGFFAAARSANEQVIVDVNAIDVDLDAERRPVPVRLRERIRAFGPTVQYGEAALQQLVA